jgi:predicted esterase
MSFSKILCVAAAGSILFSGAAMARPDVTVQPATTAQAGTTHVKHSHRGHHKVLRKHHSKHAHTQVTTTPANTQ